MAERSSWRSISMDYHSHQADDCATPRYDPGARRQPAVHSLRPPTRPQSSPNALELVDRIKELRYFDCPRKLVLSLGPAPNLKVLYLRPPLTIEEPEPLISLPVIFSGCLPSLRHLDPSNTVTWPAGLFRRLSSFRCGILDHFPIFPVHVLDVIRESPLLKHIHLRGCYNGPLGFDPSPSRSSRWKNAS